MTNNHSDLNNESKSVCAERQERGGETIGSAQNSPCTHTHTLQSQCSAYMFSLELSYFASKAKL